MPARRPAVELPNEAEPFGVFDLLGLLLRAAVAYVAGFALYVGAFQLSRKLEPVLHDEGLVNFALVLLMALVVAAILLTLFQPMWSGEMRGFALMTCFTLLAVATAQAVGFSHFDAAARFDLIVRDHLEAIRLFGR
jgi:hypothetical protein